MYVGHKQSWSQIGMHSKIGFNAACIPRSPTLKSKELQAKCQPHNLKRKRNKKFKCSIGNNNCTGSIFRKACVDLHKSLTSADKPLKTSGR